MDVTRVFDVEEGENAFGPNTSISGTISIDVTAGKITRVNITCTLDANNAADSGDNFTSFFVTSSDQNQTMVMLLAGGDDLTMEIPTSTDPDGRHGPGLINYVGGELDGEWDINEGEGPGSQLDYDVEICPSLSSPAGDLFLIADHDTTRTVIAPLQTSQVIAVVGSNVAFDGAADFNNDGLSDLLAHTDAGGVRTLFAYQMTTEVRAALVRSAT